MLIQHGTNDLVIDYHQSVYMAEKVKAVCGEDRVELDLFENESQGSQVIKADQNIEKCIDFLDKHFTEERTHTGSRLARFGSWVRMRTNNYGNNNISHRIIAGSNHLCSSNLEGA